MYKIEISQDKTLIAVIFSGMISASKLVELYKQFKEYVKKLKCGFNVLFDFSKVERIDGHGYVILESMDILKEYAINNGMHKSALRVNVETMAQIILWHSDLLKDVYSNGHEIKEFFDE